MLECIFFQKKIFMIGEHTAKMIILTLILQSLKDVAIVTDFGTNGQCITQVPPPLFFALAFHNGWEDRNTGDGP